MSDIGIDAATAAFQAVLAPEAPKARATKEAPDGPTESVFRMGEIDGDTEEAGGDDLPLEEVDGGDPQVADDQFTDEELAEQGLSPDEIAAIRKAADLEEDDDAPPAKKGKADEDDDTDFLEQEVEITVDGEKQTVKVEEALAGYIRQETFHKRLNELVGVKDALRTEAVGIVETRQKTAERLAEVEDTLTKLLPAEPDWDKMYAEDPVKARAVQKQYEEIKTNIAAAKTEREKIVEDNAKETAKRVAEFRTSEFRTFLSKNPSFKSQADVEKETQSMRRTALALGFSEEELAETYDHRMLLVLQKASKYDRMTANKPKPVPKGAQRPAVSGSQTSKTEAPARRTQRTAPKGIGQAQQRLARTGSVEDAAAVFGHLLR